MQSTLQLLSSCDSPATLSMLLSCQSSLRLSSYSLLESSMLESRKLLQQAARYSLQQLQQQHATLSRNSQHAPLQLVQHATLQACYSPPAILLLAILLLVMLLLAILLLHAFHWPVPEVQRNASSSMLVACSFLLLVACQQLLGMRNRDEILRHFLMLYLLLYLLPVCFQVPLTRSAEECACYS